MSIIQLKRGEKINLPNDAQPGEPLLTLDTKELFVGLDDNTVSPLKVMSDNIPDKGLNNGIAELDGSGNIPRNIKTDNLLFTSATGVTVNNGQYLKIVELSKTEFRVCKWLVNITDQTTGEFYSSEILAHHNNTTAEFTEYGSIGIQTVEFSVTVEGSAICLYGLSSKNNQTIRLITTAIRFT